ncbi:hypothetical protein GALMADRAFT_214151 [Galerina marginata CBS 339.88]|uniref:Uncharacterized protein n=1 Tax=Galerina marginata (strain CBS 339.88) TaxID=685588 RepID=A0A067SMA5_GALM3|nr:hypothetical protein GALMADRAFT_214151 [Galerina marginata CBS 339.88]
MAKVGNFGHHVRKCSLLRDVKEIFQISCKEFSEPHRGNKDARVFVYLAACVSECLREYSIEEKIMILTADNASNNKNTLVEELWNVIPPLEVWSIVRMMKPAHNSDVDLSIAEDDLEVDSIKLDIECQFDLVEQGLNGDIDGIGDEQPPVDPDNEDEIAGDVRCKLRTLANKIVNSPTIREDLKNCCRQLRIKFKKKIHDVSTGWSSTAELVQWVRLACLRLSSDEWNDTVLDKHGANVDIDAY